MVNTNSRYLLAALGAAWLLATFGCEEELAPLPIRQSAAPVVKKDLPPPPDINPRLLRRFKPARAVIGDHTDLSEAKVALGRLLFHEPRIGKGQKRSCASCHQLDQYGVDGRKQPRFGGSKRNVPTVFHAAGSFDFQNGRAATIEDQAALALLDPEQSGAASAGDVVEFLTRVPLYREAFHKAFPDEAKPITFENAGRAIGAFERHLTTRARWDDFLDGNPSALTAQEAEGFKLFLNVGCPVCHTGEYLGGTMYEKLGAVQAWPNQDDQGLFETTQKAKDRMMFKVPTLRNVAQTAPYFHDGYSTTLEEAVSLMAKHQIGMTLSEEDTAAVVAWLKTLSGKLPMDYATPPDLPEVVLAQSPGRPDR